MAILSSAKAGAGGACGPWTITTGVLSFVFVLAGLLAGFLVPMYVDDGLTQILVCDENSMGYDGFKSNRDANTATYVTNILYNITNPTEFLLGNEGAEIVESRQYVYRKRSQKFDISFGHYDAEGYETVKYKVWDQYTFDPERSCDGCSDLDQFYTMSIPYSQVLTTMVSEAGFLLTAECGQNQRDAINSAEPFCESAADRLNPAGTCQCCSTLPGSNVTCAELLQPESASSAALLSFLGRMDGGAFVRDFGGAGVSALGDSHGVHTPMIVKMSVRELLLGFPSAVAGYAMANNPFTLRSDYFLGMADDFTTDYGTVCQKLCDTATDFNADTCDAVIPDTNEEIAALGFTQEEAQKYSYMRKMSCSAFPWVQVAAVIASFAPDAECVDSSKDPSDFCCLYSGTNPGTGSPLKGFGCVAEIGGGLNERMMDTLEEAKIFTAGTDYYVREMRTGCGSKMNGRDKTAREVQTIVSYKTKTSNPVWLATTDPDEKVNPMDIRNALLGAQPTVSLPVEGAYGAGVYPKGLSGDFFSEEVSDGEPLTKRFKVFPVTTRRGLDFKFDRSVTVNGIKGARFSFDYSALEDTTANRLLGQAQPAKGLIAGYFYYGTTAIIHEPLFAYGDPALLDQSDNAYLDMIAPDTNGIQILQTMEEYITYTPLETPRQVTPALLQQYEEDESLLAYVVVEPATGNYIEGHNRIASSFQIWECDPTVPEMAEACGVMATEGNCHAAASFGFGLPCSTANVLTPFLKGGKIVPVAVTDEYASISNEDAETLEAAGQAVFIARILMVVLCGLGAAFTAFSVYLYWAVPGDQGVNPKRKSYEAGVPSNLASLYGTDDKAGL